MFNGFRANSTFKAPRFAAEFVMVSEESKNASQSLTIHSKKSIDDEHTPGIFEIVEVATPKSFMAKEGKSIFWDCLLFKLYSSDSVLSLQYSNCQKLSKM